PGLQELQRRGHRVHVRIGERLIGVARDAGFEASPADPAIAAIEVNDYAEGKDTDKLRKGLHDMLRRGPLERADLERAIAEQQPDMILVDSPAYGAPAAMSPDRAPRVRRARRRGGERAAMGVRPAVAAAAAGQGHPALRPGHE